MYPGEIDSLEPILGLLKSFTNSCSGLLVPMTSHPPPPHYAQNCTFITTTITTTSNIRYSSQHQQAVSAPLMMMLWGGGGYNSTLYLEPPAQPQQLRNLGGAG